MICPNIMVHQGNTPFHPDLAQIGLQKARNIWWNLPPARLIERTLLAGEGKLTSTGALAIETGRFTGRSPQDRFIVKDDLTRDQVWWGDINKGISMEHASALHADMMQYLDGKERGPKRLHMGSHSVDSGDHHRSVRRSCA